MQINITSVGLNMNGRNLRPLSEYQGPILKLTTAEKSRIAKLEETISDLRFEIHALEKKIIKPRMRTMQENFYYGQIEHLESWISSLKKEIKQIKINRFNKQKETLAKKKLDKNI